MRKYHHLGIPTTEKREGEVHLKHLKIYVSGYKESPYHIEWMRYEPDAPYPELVKSLPHVAFEVDDLEQELKGKKVIIPPNSPTPGVTVAFIEDNGAPIEFLQIDKTQAENVFTWLKQFQSKPRSPSVAARLGFVRPMRIVRWILLPIVCIAAWIAALFAGIVAHAVAEFFCPAHQIVSGTCVAPWFETLDTWLVRFFSAFAAALIVVSCYFTAPAARALVAWVVFGVGAVYALWIAVVSWAWGEFVAAGVGGMAAVLLLTRGQNIFRRTRRVAP